MPFAVVMDVPPIQAEAAQRALTTCNAALGAEQCGLASEGVVARWYAIVRFDADRRTVLTIELLDGGGAHPRVASSQLEFKDSDSERERWASAGVVVAALVAAQTALPADAKPAPPVTTDSKPVPHPHPGKRQRPRPARPVPARPLWLRVDVGATGGSEIEQGALRLGAISRVGVAFSELPVFAFGSLAYTVRGRGTPELTWLTASVGFGVYVALDHGRYALDVRTEGVLESVGIRASDGTRTESTQRTRMGPRFGLDLGAYVAKNLALLVGAEAAAFRPGLDISIGGREVSRLPPFNWGFISAVRYDFR